MYTTMLRVAITLVSMFYAAIHSMPVDNCISLSCGILTKTLTENMPGTKFSGPTSAKNVTNGTLINCNLNIFLKELNASWHCESPNKKNTFNCQFYNLLECIPRSCKVLNTTCQDPKGKTPRQNLKEAMKSFLETVARELPNSETSEQ